MRFEGKVVLVTGGNRGIGFATARLFESEGAAVTITGRNLVKGEGAAKELKALFIPADVRQAADCSAAVAKTLDWLADWTYS